MLILKSLIYNGYFSVELIEHLLKTEYDIQNDVKSIESAIDVLNLDFSKKDKKDFPELSFMNEFQISNEFKEYLAHETYRKHILDVINYGLLKYKTEYNAQVEGENLTLYAKYSRRDVCRLLNWPNDDSSTLYGYRVKHNTCPIFVTYDKKEDISDSTKYPDKFLNKHICSLRKVMVKVRITTIWVRSNHLILFRQLSKAKTETCRLSILNIISIFQLKMSCMTILRTKYR